QHARRSNCHRTKLTALARHRFIPRPRNSTEMRPLDAHAKALPLFERPAALQGFPLRRLVSATLGNAYLAVSGLLAVLRIVGTVKAPIAGVELGRSLENFLMTVQRRLHLVAVGRIALQLLVVGDQALRALGQEDLVPEFHRLAFLASLDQV